MKKVASIRREWYVPAVVYWKHIAKPILIDCFKNDFLRLYKETGFSTPITLKGDGTDEFVLIHDIQKDPVTDYLIHIDFLAVRRDEKVTADIQLVLSGESTVEKLGEWKIQLVRDTIEVEAFPQDLPHNIIIDISKIKTANDVIFVKDLDVWSKVEILDDPEQPVVTVLALAEEVVETPVVEEAATSTDAKKPVAEAKKSEEKK